MQHKMKGSSYKNLYKFKCYTISVHKSRNTSKTLFGNNLHQNIAIFEFNVQQLVGNSIKPQDINAQNICAFLIVVNFRLQFVRIHPLTQPINAKQKHFALYKIMEWSRLGINSR